MERGNSNSNPNIQKHKKKSLFQKIFKRGKKDKGCTSGTPNAPPPVAEERDVNIDDSINNSEAWDSLENMSEIMTEPMSPFSSDVSPPRAPPRGYRTPPSRRSGPLPLPPPPGGNSHSSSSYHPQGGYNPRRVPPLYQPGHSPSSPHYPPPGRHYPHSNYQDGDQACQTLERIEHYFSEENPNGCHAM